MQDQVAALLKQLKLDDLENGLAQSPVQTTETLSLLAGEIRDTLSSSTLPQDISALLFTAIKAPSAESIDVTTQIGRVAANLAANCDAGRDALLDAQYIDRCCQRLETYLEILEAAQAAVKTLTASLLNMVIEGHERSIEELSRHVSSLFKVSARIQKVSGVDGESEQVVQWIWTIIGIVLEEYPSDTYISDILLPFSSYIDTSEMALPLPVLASAAELLDTWCNRDDVDFNIYNTASVETLLDFVQKATPREVDLESGNDDDKSLAAIKGNILNALIGLSSFIPASQTFFWTRMRSWLSETERDDLQSCAVLCFGNCAREDTSAINLLQGEDTLLSAILQILVPGITAQVLHSVIGLLRNLSIPDPNKVILGETDLLNRLMEVGVWATDKDMLGSVQGGGVGIVKNLCRGNSINTVRLAQHPVAINEILELYQRTDDAAIKFEATRVFVNCIRSISSPGAAEKSMLGAFEDARIVSVLFDMFKQSGPYPVLANESIIALALLVSFGSELTRASIRKELLLSTARILEILAPKEGDEMASKEVRSNLTTLLRQADVVGERGSFLADLRSVLKPGDLEGRQFCEEGAPLLV